MFTHSFVSALAIAATFSQAALGASDSGRQIARLARRDGQTSVEGNAFISAWSNLSPAFSQCHQTIQSHVEASASIQTHVEVSAAMEAVNNLAIQATAVASQYGSIDGHFAAEGPHACIPCVNQYKEIVSQQFLSLQAIMSLGVQTYGQQWKSSFGPSCDRFGSFIKVVNSICMSLNINLGGLIVDMHIDQHLFIQQGINLNYLVTGLVGSNSLLGSDNGSGGQGSLLGGGAEGGLLGDVLR